MSLKTTFKVSCDSCHAPGPAGRAEHEAEEMARRKGWKRGNAQGHSLHLCKACAAAPPPDWWPSPCGTKFHWEET